MDERAETYKIPVSELRWTCDHEALGLDCTVEMDQPEKGLLLRSEP